MRTAIVFVRSAPPPAAPQAHWFRSPIETDIIIITPATNATITIMSYIITVITKNFIVIPELNRVRTIFCQKHDTIRFFCCHMQLPVLWKCLSDIMSFITRPELVMMRFQVKVRDSFPRLGS